METGIRPSGWHRSLVCFARHGPVTIISPRLSSQILDAVCSQQLVVWFALVEDSELLSTDPDSWFLDAGRFLTCVWVVVRGFLSQEFPLFEFFESAAAAVVFLLFGPARLCRSHLALLSRLVS